MDDPIIRWNTLINGDQPTAELRKAMWFVAYTLSSTTHQAISTAMYRITNTSIGALTARADDLDTEAVGVYLLMGDDLPGQAMLILKRSAALAVLDLMKGLRPGTTTILGDAERMALAELGTIAMSSFLNVVAQPSWGALQPSPPAVMIGTLGTVLDAIATSIATSGDTLKIIDTTFQDTAQSCPMQFWIIPNPPVHAYV